MPFCPYAARKSSLTQPGNSAHSASFAGKCLTAVNSSPSRSGAAKAASARRARPASAPTMADRFTANDSPIAHPSCVRLFFAERNILLLRTQAQKQEKICIGRKRGRVWMQPCEFLSGDLDSNRFFEGSTEPAPSGYVLPRDQWGTPNPWIPQRHFARPS